MRHSVPRTAAAAPLASLDIMADRDILPRHLKPAHYRLCLSGFDFKAWTYKGTVTIEAEIVEPTDRIVVNALELKISHASVTVDQAKSSQSFETTDVSYDGRAQRATIKFDSQLPVARRAAVVVDFEGVINNDMAGFYRSRYRPEVMPPAEAGVPHDDEWHYMLSTQFESCDARRAFPCFDEPNLKASFDLELEMPSGLVALANMPVREERPSGRDGFKLVSFETTPVMSTYLLAWAVGDFKYVEALTERRYNGKRLPVRVYATRGLEEQGRWALEHAHKIIDFFSTVFGIDYPLPKADLLAVHEFTHGAMENWGLVTYRTTAVLYDERTSDARFRNAVAYVVAHELAHQWFGNLVTMDWWDELWLNEGFATWVGWYAIDHLHPDWEVWAQFINEGMEAAFRLDGIRASHPIHVPVRDALDVNQIFDNISYLKGCSVIRMLAAHLGVEVFLSGVSRYLAAHTYGNARTDDLWRALTEASGQDVTALMGPWISRVGHPVLTVAEEPGQLTVAQSRYLSSGDVGPDDDVTTWWLPLGFEGRRGGRAGVADKGLSLTTKKETIRDVDDGFYKFNSGATGFYRVSYPPARLARMSTQLARLSAEDRIAIIGSTAEMAFSGHGTTASLLTLLVGFRDETHPIVWTQLLDSIDSVRSVFGGDAELRGGIDALARDLVDKKVREVGWESAADEGYLGSILRKQLMNAALGCRHAATVDEALGRFDAWVSDPEKNPIPPSLRVAVWRAAARADAKRAFAVLKKEWSTTKSVDGKLLCLQAMGAAQDEEAIRTAILPFNFGTSSDSVPAGDMHVLGQALAEHPVGRDAQWAYLKANWEACVAKLGNPIVLDRFVRLSLGSFVDEGVVSDMDAFFEGKDTGAFNRTLGTVRDRGYLQ
ncbi:aminopeptidase 2 [Ophiocordyceps camponoti-floridani]|uniref:Aminopeptidase n=1 Tax=Ophiocordyceps camponoti-floridani TaxID=2030778 RepID=A0A8H4Q8P1_9HYPO|nr:aminopeptidase 2 [Ophiocordyceps camponoti-floridani]